MPTPSSAIRQKVQFFSFVFIFGAIMASVLALQFNSFDTRQQAQVYENPPQLSCSELPIDQCTNDPRCKWSDNLGCVTTDTPEEIVDDGGEEEEGTEENTPTPNPTESLAETPTDDVPCTDCGEEGENDAQATPEPVVIVDDRGTADTSDDIVIANNSNTGSSSNNQSNTGTNSEEESDNSGSDLSANTNNENSVPEKDTEPLNDAQKLILLLIGMRD